MVTTVVDELRETLLSEVPDIDGLIVEKVCLGLGYTGVKLRGGQAGVCHSLLSEMAPECCTILESAGTLAGRAATEFLGMASSWDLGERVIGMATVNALSQIVFDAHPDRYALEEKNLVDVIEVGPEDIVVLIGLVKPFVPVFRARAKRLHILERGVGREEGVLPDTACEEVVPEADVVVITGSSLANGTVDRLLELAEDARTVALVGPTVSCIPDPLFRRGADYAGGIRIRDADKALQVIAEGGGTPRLRMAGEFVTFKAR
jgi:uncharacterized protein (DUF4213/DUF364 family)